MLCVSMQEFLRTGDFGPLRPGDARQKLLDVLGEPESWGTQMDWPKASIWKYGDIGFHMPERGDGDDRLWLIFADHIETLQGGQAIDLDAWVVDSDTLLEEFKTEMTRAGIGFEPMDWPWSDEITMFRTASGIDVGFIDRDGVHSLFSFSLCRG